MRCTYSEKLLPQTRKSHRSLLDQSVPSVSLEYLRMPPIDHHQQPHRTLITISIKLHITLPCKPSGAQGVAQSRHNAAAAAFTKECASKRVRPLQARHTLFQPVSFVLRGTWHINKGLCEWHVLHVILMSRRLVFGAIVITRQISFVAA